MDQIALPLTPRERVRFSGLDRWRLPLLASVFGGLGVWDYPMRAEGDLERMKVLDKAYWLHKSVKPIRNARRNSGLEAFFENQTCLPPDLPDDFAPISELKLTSAGDLIPHPYLENSADILYAEIDELLFGSDVSMANLEGPVTPHGGDPYFFTSHSGPTISFSPQEFSVIKGPQAKPFTFLATASNHSLDFGNRGVDYTLETLDKEGIYSHGLNRAGTPADQPVLVEGNGIRVAIISFTFGVNGFDPPPSRPHIVNRADLNGKPGAADVSRICSHVLNCCARNVDFVIVHLHWGFEYEFYPTPEQISMAHHIAEIGADVILGHHPHVTQPIEYYRTARDSHRIVPIFYSLGNLVNYFAAEYLCESIIASITLVKGALSDGSTTTYVQHAGGHRVAQKVDPVRMQLRICPVST